MAEREGGKVHAFDVDTGAYVGASWHAPFSWGGEVGPPPHFCLLCSAASWGVWAFTLPCSTAAGAWNLLEKHGLPFDVTLGPYGSVLVLSWQRDAPPNRVWVVALGPDPGQFAG